MPNEFKLERDMRPVVDTWLEQQGLTPLHEVQIWHMVDVIAVEFEPRTSRLIPPLKKAIAIELKLKDIAGVRSQTRNNRGLMHESYAAMPSYICDRMQRRTKNSFSECGLGLLSVNPESQIVNVIVKPTYKGKPHDRMRKKLWRRYRSD